MDLVATLKDIKDAPNFYAYKVYVLRALPDGQLKTELKATVDALDYFNRKDEIITALGG